MGFIWITAETQCYMSVRITLAAIPMSGFIRVPRFQWELWQIGSFAHCATRHTDISIKSIIGELWVSRRPTSGSRIYWGCLWQAPISEWWVSITVSWWSKSAKRSWPTILAAIPGTRIFQEVVCLKLTAEERSIVEDNMGLVGRVIKDKVHLPSGLFTYEDLFQIGCIGLCKAAATDRGGCFSTYAYRCIFKTKRG